MIDPVSVLADLGAPDARVIAPVTGGRDTAIWRVRWGVRDCALRVFRADQAGAAARELSAMGTARAGGVSVPEIHLAGQWQGRPALLVSWCPGRTLLAELEARPWRAVALGRMLGRQQAAIHRLPSPLELLSPSWVDRMGPDAPELHALLTARPQPARLLHLDYHPLNVLTDGNRVTAVIDWVDARAGDPRADLARTYVILRLEPVHEAPAKAFAFELLRRLLTWAWLDGYRAAAGPVTGLRPFMAWAGLHLARALAQREAAGERGLTAEHVAAVRAWASRQRDLALANS